MQIVGLRNHSNSSFLNAVLQCAFATRPLRTFFLDNRHTNDTNRTNPLGHQGRFADTIAALFRAIGDSNHSANTPSSSTVIDPIEFLDLVHEVAPMFRGVDLHDAFDFAGFLLDALHEDLNRITNPTWMMSPDPFGRSDDDIANDWWASYERRNSSVLVDHVFGHVKTVNSCPSCEQSTFTFDPLPILSLHIPFQDKLQLHVTMCSRPGAPSPSMSTSAAPVMQPTVYGFRLGRQSRVTHLCEMIGRKFDVDPNEIVLAYVRDSRIMCKLQLNAFVSDAMCLSETQGDVWGFHAPVIKPGDIENDQQQQQSKKLTVATDDDDDTSSDPHINLAEQANIHSLLIHHCLERDERHETFGVPFVINVGSRDVSSAVLKDTIVSVIDSVVQTHVSVGTDYEICDDRCHPFDFSRETVQIFYDLRLNIVWKSEGSTQRPISLEPILDESYHKLTDDDVTLNECLRHFMMKQIVSYEEPFFCETCLDFQHATRQSLIYSTSDILIVHLKRFEYVSERFMIRNLVDFPLEGLDMSRYTLKKTGVPDEFLYDCYAVVRFVGSAHGGHWNAFINNGNDEWMLVDDDRVERVADLAEIVSADAYMLFYQRRSLKHL